MLSTAPEVHPLRDESWYAHGLPNSFPSGRLPLFILQVTFSAHVTLSDKAIRITQHSYARVTEFTNSTKPLFDAYILKGRRHATTNKHAAPTLTLTPVIGRMHGCLASSLLGFMLKRDFVHQA